MTTSMPPLSGLRVLDFSTLLPGPLAGLLLAEAGAEVIKVERPGTGDEMRAYAPSFDDAGGNFALLNRGKASLTADLKDAGDREHVLGLARDADVVIEQFRPGVMDRLGLGYAALAADNPRLIYCSITGYGQTGARAQQAGHDLNYMAETGLLGLSGDTDRTPVLPPVLAADIAGGAYPAVMNILMALVGRSTTGTGCHLDVAMADNLFAFAYWGLASGHSGAWPQTGQALVTGASPRYQIYRTADGRHLAAAPIEERFWQVFCDRIGLEPEHRDDTADPAGILRRVADLIGRRSAAEWRAVFGDADVCVSVVATLEEAASDPAYHARGLFARSVTGRRSAMPALPVPLDPGLRDEATARPFPARDDAARRIGWAAR